MRRYWNHNTHYNRLLLRQLPPTLDLVLDIGCGDGLFAAQLAERARAVLAIDCDLTQVEEARERTVGDPRVTVKHADFISEPLRPESFDAVTSLAVMHHLPFEEAITTMKQVVRPGGRLLILGVWPSRATTMDIVISVVAVVVNRVYVVIWGEATMNAPVENPTASLRDIRRALKMQLPGATVRRRLLWRYTVSWTKPTVGVASIVQP